MPWLLFIPAGILFWLLTEGDRAANRTRREREEPSPPEFSRMPWDHFPHAPPPPPTRSPPRRPAISTAADYLRHLNEACWASRTLDRVKQAALTADVAALMQSPPETEHALRVLCQPIEASFLQKDLNILGSDPPLLEDGKFARPTIDAIKAFQGRFNLPQTGEVDAATVAALRYAVGCIYSQDKVAHGGT